MGSTVLIYVLLHLLSAASAFGTVTRTDYSFNVDIQSQSFGTSTEAWIADKYSAHCKSNPTGPIQRKACDKCFSDHNYFKRHQGTGRGPGCRNWFPTPFPTGDELLPGKFTCEEEIDICVCDSHPILDKYSGLCVSRVQETFCWGVSTMSDLAPSDQWCNADESRRLYADVCEKAYRTGSDGHVYPCVHNRDNSNPACSLKSSSAMCCDHLCAKLSKREEVNAGKQGEGPYCGKNTPDGKEKCKASYWTGANGKTYPCIWKAAAGRRRLLFSMLPRPADIDAYDDVGPFKDPRDADEAYRYQDELPLEGEETGRRVTYSAGGVCRLSLSDSCEC